MYLIFPGGDCGFIVDKYEFFITFALVIPKVLPLTACCLLPPRACPDDRVPLTAFCLLPPRARCISLIGPALMAVWSKVLPLTARWLSPPRACPDGRVV